ncbi:MAG: maleylpyruvate isomerase family mycothiol-dependent enzyme [Acidimicrobiales bacterium]
MTEELSNAEVYAGLRADTIELVKSLTPDEAATKVPQSPAWSIRDVIAHVVGIIDDMLSDNLAGIGTDGWTEAQVAQRAGRSLAEICDEWEESAPAFAAMAEANPIIPMRAGADLITHHHDILQALGRQGDRNSAAVRMGLERYGPFFCERAETAGLPIVRVEAGNQMWQSRDGAPAAVLTATAFELLRAFSGRRSATQILAMNWTGDAAPYLDVVTPYGLPTEDVLE